MSNISAWSNSAGGNTAAAPNGWPEGMAPSSVNDCAREMMAATRTWYESSEWIDYGYSVAFSTTASFTLAGDRTSQFHTGRRIKCSDASILYGIIVSSTYTSNTLVTISLDSGELAASLSAVAVGILSINNSQIRKTPIYDHGSVASATYTVNMSVADVHLIEYSGTGTLAVMSSLPTDKSTLIVKNNNFPITLDGIDNDSPSLTQAVTTQDFFTVVKSFGKISCIATWLNIPTT